MKTPTTEPAVPSALGANPAPPAVAIAIAIQSVALNGSLFVFTIPIRLVDFFRRSFLGGQAKFFAGPFAEIDQLTTFAAKRAVWIVFILDFFFAGRAFHTIRAMTSYSRLSVISTL